MSSDAIQTILIFSHSYANTVKTKGDPHLDQKRGQRQKKHQKLTPLGPHLVTLAHPQLTLSKVLAILYPYLV